MALVPPDSEWMSVADAAGRLGVTEDAIRKRVKSEGLATEMGPGGTRVFRPLIEAERANLLAKLGAIERSKLDELIEQARGATAMKEELTRLRSALQSMIVSSKSQAEALVAQIDVTSQLISPQGMSVGSTIHD